MSIPFHEIEYYSPTLNKEDFVVRENVPIFRELIDDDGTVYDQRFLAELVENSKKREETGDLILLSIGHTQRNVPETDQPEFVGYAKDLKLAKDKKTNDVLVVADLYINKEDSDRAFTFPRRSAEIWVDDKYIDIVSLLRQAPKCDLGLLAANKVSSVEVGSGYAIFKKSGDSLAKNQKAEVNKIMDKEEMKKLIRECLAEDAQEKKKDKPLTDDAKPTEMEKSDLGETFGEMVGVGVNVGEGIPGGNNTSIPTDDKKHMQKSTEAIHANLFQRENETLKAENAALKLHVKKFSREKDLIQLEAEGVLLNRAEELEYIEDLNDAQYEKHLARVRKQYQKLPINKVPVSHERAVDEGVKNSIDPKIVAEVAKFARQNQINDFSTAFQRFTQWRGRD